MDSSTSLPNDDAAAGGSPTGRPSRRTSTGAAWAGGPPAARPSGTTSRPRENRWRHVPRPGQQGGHGWIAGDTALPAARPGTAGPGRIARSTSPPEGRGGRGRIAGSTCLPGRRGQAQLRREDPPASRAVAASTLRRRPPSPRDGLASAPSSASPPPPPHGLLRRRPWGDAPLPPSGRCRGAFPGWRHEEGAGETVRRRTRAIGGSGQGPGSFTTCGVPGSHSRRFAACQGGPRAPRRRGPPSESANT